MHFIKTSILQLKIIYIKVILRYGFFKKMKIGTNIEHDITVLTLKPQRLLAHF